MKKLSFIIFCLTLIVINNSCKKDSVISGDVNQYAVGAYLSFTGDVPAAPAPFDASDISNSTVSISVKNVGSPAKEVNIYVGETPYDKSTWKLIKTVSFTDSGTLSVTGGEVATALGVDVSSFQVGDVFNFFNEVVTTDGRTFNPENTSSDFQAQAAYKMALQWQATIFCAFDQSVFTGSWEVVTDGWADYSPGDVIPNAVAPGPGPNQITMYVYPNPDYGNPINPIIIDVDPETNIATVSKQEYGDYGVVISAEGSGSVNSCTGTISLQLEHTSSGGSYGTYALVIKKI